MEERFLLEQKIFKENLEQQLSHNHSTLKTVKDSENDIKSLYDQILDIKDAIENLEKKISYSVKFKYTYVRSTDNIPKKDIVALSKVHTRMSNTEVDDSKLEDIVALGKVHTKMSNTEVDDSKLEDIVELDEVHTMMVNTEVDDSELEKELSQKENELNNLKKSKKERKASLNKILKENGAYTVTDLKYKLKLEIDKQEKQLKSLNQKDDPSPKISCFEEEDLQEPESEVKHSFKDNLEKDDNLPENFKESEAILDPEIQGVETLPSTSSLKDIRPISDSVVPKMSRTLVFIQKLKDNMDYIVGKFSGKNYFDIQPKELRTLLENLTENFDKVKGLYTEDSKNPLLNLHSMKVFYKIFEKIILELKMFSLVDFTQINSNRLKDLIDSTTRPRSDLENSFLSLLNLYKKHLSSLFLSMVKGEESMMKLNSTFIKFLPRNNTFAQFAMQKSLHSLLKKVFVKDIDNKSLPKQTKKNIASYEKSLCDISNLFVSYIFKKHPNILSLLNYVGKYNDLYSFFQKKKKLFDDKKATIRELEIDGDTKINEFLFLILNDAKSKLSQSLKSDSLEKELIESFSLLTSKYAEASTDADELNYSLDNDPSTEIWNMILTPLFDGLIQKNN